MSHGDSLAPFSAPTAAWFRSTFAGCTDVQARGWAAIASGAHTLMLAPTGSGKTLAAFLSALDRLATTPRPEPKRVRVLYVSPLKALVYDVEKNLRGPLRGIGDAAAVLGLAVPNVTVGIRTGDTTTADREALRRSPPDILVTTPESLFLMLLGRAREALRHV